MMKRVTCRPVPQVTPGLTIVNDLFVILMSPVKDETISARKDLEPLAQTASLAGRCSVWCW